MQTLNKSFIIIIFFFFFFFFWVHICNKESLWNIHLFFIQIYASNIFHVIHLSFRLKVEGILCWVECLTLYPFSALERPPNKLLLIGQKLYFFVLLIWRTDFIWSLTNSTIFDKQICIYFHYWINLTKVMFRNKHSLYNNLKKKWNS